MLDIQELRKQPQKIQENFNRRGYSVLVEDILTLDREKLKIQTGLQELKQKKNELSKTIVKFKKNESKKKELILYVKELNEKIGKAEDDLSKKAGQLNQMLIRLPNLLADSVPNGAEEQNEILKVYGTKPNFDFLPLNHLQLSQKNQLINYQLGSELIGNGYWIYQGLGARLEWALLNFCLEENQKSGYEMLMLPPVAKDLCGFGAGQFPKFEHEVYKIEGEEQFLIPTAETLLVNLHQNQILDRNFLPLKYTAYTPCFRKEGSKHPNEKGIIRGHQFNKVEMVQFTTKEQAGDALLSILAQAEKLMQKLNLHYRVVRLASRECSASMGETYDLEVWLPAEQIYKEVSSISNAYTYQTRRTNTRYKDEKGKNQYVYTLNGSGLATSRLFAAILEQNQRKDGQVEFPAALKKWIL